MKKNKARIRIKTNVILVFAAIFFCLIVYSIGKIVMWKTDVNANTRLIGDLKKCITVDSSKNLKEKYSVDFNRLKRQNNDVTAWINVNGTDIKYPILKCKDNNYYLGHNFLKEKNRIGWLYMDYKNSDNIVIYGSNRMYKSLNNTLKIDWQKKVKNNIIVLVMENDSYIYKVFSTYSIRSYNYKIPTKFKNKSEYEEYLKQIKQKSNHNYKVQVDSDDSILTLYSGVKNNKKIFLHAKRIF